ncbi:MAG: thioredoxin reductase [Candidatus Methanomethylophilaceae archaeon]|nr:thioredoxin reductase [Candidatus Methanomethylophilaceae archaeon]
MGAAGLQAAITAARKKASTLVLGKPEDSALWSAEVENYFGVPRVKGRELVSIAMEQASAFGAELFKEDAIALSKEEGVFTITSESGRLIQSKTLVFASGISRKKLNIPGEKEFFGKGVSYCASCDCNFYKGVPVAIIGEGSEAAISAELMTNYASRVYWIVETPQASEHLKERAVSAGVELVAAKPKEIVGDSKVAALILSNGRRLAVNGVFIELGARSSTDMAMDLGIIPDPEGTIKVDRNCRTGVEAIFACGDITGKPWQVAKAVGEGCVAGTEAAAMARGV